MDYEALAAAYNQMVPFANHVGVHVDEVGPGTARVTLPDGPERMNHVQSQHAGALFTAGEAASGGAFVGGFAERMADITPLAEKAEIRYRKIARGPITARATLSADNAELLEEMDREGRVRFTVEVALTDPADELVAEMSVGWYVRKKT
jgi:acyl-coenzyme A thioesterase PaaI-like protein